MEEGTFTEYDHIPAVDDFGLSDDTPLELTWEKLLRLLAERLFFDDYSDDDVMTYLFGESPTLLAAFNVDNDLVVTILEPSDGAGMIIRWEPDGSVTIPYKK